MLIFGVAFGLIAILVVAAFLVAPMIKKMVGKPTISKPGADSTPVPIVERDFKDAFRDARDAQRAAEELSMTMFRFAKNKELMDLTRNRGDDAGTQTYRRNEESLELTRLDAETAFLIAAKRLNGYPTEASEKAYKDIEDEVSRAGVGWRTRLAQMLPKYVSRVTPDTVRVEPVFLDELKDLQPKP